jgi:GntR family transcriptional regulator / MocR family aminotransferase
VRSALPAIRLDARAKGSLSSQICEFVRDAILRGTVAPDAYLPSTRALAATLGVSRNTVAHAYEALWADGLIYGTPGSGTRVNPALAVRLGRPLARIPPEQILREAHYPARIRRAEDPEGNPLVLYSVYHS